MEDAAQAPAPAVFLDEDRSWVRAGGIGGTQPTAATIIRLATCAVFAYLIALPVPETSPPVLAPLTAMRQQGRWVMR
jgi:hypothetical protein